MHKQVLYFSIWPESRLEFADKAKEYEKKCDFQIIENGSFSCASDLLLYLDEHYKQLKQLYVIIDYLPFFSKEFNYKKEAEFISRSIMGYPEVYFMFDESYVKNNEPDLDFTLFLYKNKTQIDKLAKQYHIFNFSDKYPFCALTNQRSNLFDGTNLRYCLKCDLYDSMKAGCHNYKRIQSSRCDNLVICVEEESSQNKFNSYSLYANGFRVWPIMSAFELKDFNQAYNQTYKRDDLRIIVRDYDLQFSDADVDDDDLIIASMKSNENLVDYIRGAKYVEKEETWYSYEGKTENHFWNNLGNIPRFYISKGVEGIDIVTNYEKYTDFCRKRDIFEKTDISLFKDEVKHQILRGMYKPVTGIYSFQNYEIIKNRYDKDVRWDEREKVVKNMKLSDDEKKKEEYYIHTARKNHDHGVPLDIYDLTKEMIDRASRYQKEGDYVLSAMVAQEAIEVLNGFHELLMLNAYHIYVVSENAICMNLLGGNENRLVKDTFFRVNKIQHELGRMLARVSAKEVEEEENRKNLHINILNQLFSDCRSFCKKKEHFRSESVFIGAMSHLNEGYELSDIIYGLRVILKKIRTVVKQVINKKMKHEKNSIIA